MAYDFKKIEKKWQKKWEEKKIFQVKKTKKKKKFYVLDMFPYPSGEGLHMGHAFVYSLGDIFARFKRLQGFNVFYPIGFDSLGLPAENAAIKAGIHPEEYTKKSISNFMKQQKAMGWSYDWSRMVKSSDPRYYKWDQWIFLKMLEKGIAYRKKAPVNWCPKCNTVLANEQVVSGKCWRHDDTEIEIKHLEQWFFKITDYVEDLLKGLQKIDWPQRAKIMQENWIGKSEGVDVSWKVKDLTLDTFTTTVDTIYGVTFFVISPEHPKLKELVTKEHKEKVEAYLEKTKHKTDLERMESREKTGVFTGSYIINPLTKKECPILVADYVLMSYGTGFVMGVPAHDQRDKDFAKKYNLEIIQVLESNGKSFVYDDVDKYNVKGKIINSGKFNGLSVLKGREAIIKELEKRGVAKRTIQYKLKDWLISRQRYWGTPIPIVYCDKCGIIPVPEKELPVKLPKNVKFGKGNPLVTNSKFVNAKCPKCKGKARRETDTMDTFVNSSWYYLRYTDSKNDKKIFDPKKANYWTPIDQYIGGPEHITCHLIYIRFYTKFLKKLGLLKFDEPALKYFTQGIVKGADGERMSKSKGNVIEPIGTINKYGADSLRLYLVSTSSPDSDFDWSEKGIEGSSKFVNKVYDYFSKLKPGKVDAKTESKLNKTIKEVTKDIENFRHNLAIIKIRDLFNSFTDVKVDKQTAEAFLKLLHIYCPFVTEELWNKLRNKNFISFEKWPVADEKKINKKFEEEEKVIEKLVSDINHITQFIDKKSKKAYIYVIPKEEKIYFDNLNLIKKRTELDIKIFSVNDKNKYDPENKSKKVKPGRPGIYLE